MKHPAPDDRLTELVGVRMFRTMRKEVDGFCRRNPDLWHDESAFVRAAVNKLILELQNEELRRFSSRRKVSV